MENKNESLLQEEAKLLANQFMEHAKQKRYLQARWTLKKLKKLDPRHPRVFNHYGNYYEMRGKEDEAFQAYQKAAKMNYPIALYNLGRIANQEGNEELAASYFGKAVLLGPCKECGWFGEVYANTSNFVGDVYLEMGKTKEAIQAYQAGINVGNSNAINNLGLLYLEEKEYTKAKELFEKAYERRHIMAAHNLGCVYQDTNQITLAQKWYLHSIQVFDNLQSLENLGYLYEESGREEEGSYLVALAEKLYQNSSLTQQDRQVMRQLFKEGNLA